MLRLLLALVATAVVSAAVAAPAVISSAVAAPATISTDHVSAKLVVRNAATAPGGTVDIAIRHTLAEGWHTYWINPGDSGEPPIVEWTLPAGAVAGAMRFPAPTLVPYPPLMNHGYSDTFTLLSTVTVPPEWRAGTPLPLTVRVDWLVCKDVCIPEGGEATLSIPTGATTIPDSTVAFSFVDAERALPKESDAAATYTRDGERIYLTVPFGAPDGTHFFAENRDALAHAAAQTAVEAADGAGMTIALEAGRGRLDGTLEGVLRTGGGSFRIVATGEADPVPPPAAAAAALAPPTRALGTVPQPPPPPPIVGLGEALVLAFFGGLVLNLMPCVFPVLALKALGLVRHADASAARRAAIGGAYTAGILATFAVLAVVLLALKSAGIAVGWGFQLQSPAFVTILALVVFAVGLNLSGVFEVGAAFTRLGSRGPQDGLAGSFATGALATVVATPCTAPFMAVAIGAALAASPPTMFAVFGALGLGLAAPFVVLAAVPGLARLLPRPGLWMVRLRQALAFPLYATAAWLVWVLAHLAGPDALLPALAAFVLVGLAAWLAGLSQLGGRGRSVATGLALASLAGAALAVWPAATGTPPAAITSARAAALAEPFSPGRLAALQAEGRPVFVNVTAAWCITCKVNERVALETESFRDLLARTGTVYLQADWTRRDPDVSRFIATFGRAGVPLYVHYPSGGAPEVLPQILTPATLEDALG